MTSTRYLDTHEWHRLDGQTVTLGISRFAVDELTDVTYVQLPAVGDQVHAGKPIGEIESVKATSDIYCGVSGKIIQVNEKAVADPSIINHAPQSDGWLVKIQIDSPQQFDALMDEAAYNKKYPTGN